MNKNIIMLTRQDLSDYKNPIAPSFWKTVYAYIENGWKMTIINAHSFDVAEHMYEDKYVFAQFRIPYVKLSRIRKLGKFFIGMREHATKKKFVSSTIPIIERLLNNNDKVIVYSYEVSTVAAGKYLSQKYHIPFVSRFQGTILYGITNNAYNRWRFKPHFDALMTPADLVIMTDDGTKGDEVLAYLNNKSKTLFYRNGVDFAQETGSVNITGVDDRDIVLMTLSRLASWKRIDRAIAALPYVEKAYPNIKLVIVGYGEEEERLRSLAEEKGVSNNVIFAGQIKHKETFSYINRANIFLSLYDLSNLGNPLFEAMRCGKPIITIDIGDTKSVIKNEENGILLSDGSSEKVSAAIIRLINDKELAKRLGQSAKEYASKYFWTWRERMEAELKEVNKLITMD